MAYTYGTSVDTYSQDVGDNSVRNPAAGLAQFPSLINLKGSPVAGFQGDRESWVARPVLAERGNSDFDIRHNLMIIHIIELPVGPGRALGSDMPRALDAIVGGFSLSGLAQLRSSVPVYLSAGVDYGDVGIASSPRPALRRGSLDDVYAGGSYDETQFWIPKTEADQLLGIPANVTDPYAPTRRNSLFGPSVRFYDVSVIRRSQCGNRCGLVRRPISSTSSTGRSSDRPSPSSVMRGSAGLRGHLRAAIRGRSNSA